MKLFEILDVKQINHPKNTSISPDMTYGRMSLDHVRKSIDVENRTPILGAGVEAIVFQSKRPQDVGSVTKWLRNQTTDSSSNPVIKYLTQSQQYNIHLAPKVYNITQYKRPNGLYEYSIQMEKLHMTLEQYLDKIDNDPLLSEQLLNQVYQPNARPNFKLKLSVLDQILFGLKNITPESNKRVIQYINFMKSVNTSDPKSLDIHGANVMVRLTSVGPQLVITDPVLGTDK
jgi:hypothetical protein